MKTKAVARYKDGKLVGYCIWCQGCKCSHFFPTDTEVGKGHTWTFSGSLESPTFKPSLRLYYIHPETKAEVTTCHCIVTGGKIQFCGDCEHELKGQTLNLEDIPDSYQLAYKDA